MTREQYIRTRIEKCKEFSAAAMDEKTRKIALVGLDFYESCLEPKPDPLDRIAHALEVIAAAMTNIEPAIAAGVPVSGPFQAAGYDETVARIKAGGNY